MDNNDKSKNEMININLELGKLRNYNDISNQDILIVLPGI